MSTEEQDQIHGRLLRERRECRIRMAAITAKVLKISGDLTHAGSSMLLLVNPASEPGAARRALADLPSPEELIALVDEFSTQRRALHALETQLAQFPSE